MARPPVSESLPSHLRGLKGVLHLAERHGQRCGGPILLAGLVLGAGVVELGSGPLGQTSRFSLELLTLLLLQLVGPMVVTLLAMALLLPLWLAHVERHGARVWRVALPAAALVGALLLLWFLSAALVGGVLASPRADLIGELRDLLGGVLLTDVLRSLLRAAVFLVILCAFSQWRGHRKLGQGLDPALVISNLLGEGLMLLLGLKLVWILALDPLQLGGVAR